MTRNDELKAGQGLSVERVRALLKAGESFAGANELMGHAHVLAEAYLGSEAQLEAVTLERDRLAHELRLLREAVGGLSQKWAQKADDCGEAAMRFEEGSEAGASMGATSSTYDKCASAARLILTPLSSDTPERSGGEGQ